MELCRSEAEEKLSSLLQKEYKGTYMTFIYNVKGKMENPQFLHMDQPWNGSDMGNLDLASIVGHISMFITLPATTDHTDIYKIRLIIGSHTASRIVRNISTNDMEKGHIY